MGILVLNAESYSIETLLIRDNTNFKLKFFKIPAFALETRLAGMTSSM
jgi:hypothetical protein